RDEHQKSYLAHGLPLTVHQAGHTILLGRTAMGQNAKISNRAYLACCCVSNKSDYRHRRLLRARRERPRGSRAAQKRDELATSHSITSSARASRLSGTVRPNAFAVLRLITMSFLVGACTGRSAGFSPLRMRST